MTATESIDVARATHETVLRLGGLFMTSSQMNVAAQHHGLTSSTLCLRGRVGVVGPVDAASATTMLGTFPPSIVRFAWRRTERLSAHEAASTYAGVCAAWGREQLLGVSDQEAITELAEYVVDAADLDDLPLATGWRDWLRPEDHAERLAHALMLLREVRYGLHVAAIRASGLTVPIALLASQGSTEGLRRLGWSQTEIDGARYAAARILDLDRRWARVKLSADLAFSACLSALDVYSQRILVNGLARVDSATRLA